MPLRLQTLINLGELHTSSSAARVFESTIDGFGVKKVPEFQRVYKQKYKKSQSRAGQQAGTVKLL